MPTSTEEKLLSQLRNLQLASRDGSSITPSRQLRWAVYQLLLAAAGIDPVTLEWDGREYTPEEVRQRLLVPLTPLWGHLHAELKGIAPLDHAQRAPASALGNALRLLFGLTHRKGGSSRKPLYTVDTEALERQRELLSRLGGQPTIKKLRRLHATQQD